MTQPLRRSGMLVSQILRGCEGKRRYSDEFGARAAGQVAREEMGKPFWIYKCEVCRGWHLTSKPNRKESLAADFKFPKTRWGA